MNRNFLFVLIGALAALSLGSAYLYYQERQSGIDIKIDGEGVTIEGD